MSKLLLGYGNSSSQWVTESQNKIPTFFTFGRWTIVHIDVDIYGLNGTDGTNKSKIHVV